MNTFLDQFPQVNNLHTRTQALGMAVHEGRIYYLSTAGPGTACKSIWSSLISPQGSIDCQPWADHLAGMSDLTTLYQALPNSNYQHMVCLYKRTNFVLCAAPEAAGWTDDKQAAHSARQQQVAAALPAIHKRFVAYLNTETNLPMCAEWAAELWQVGVASGGITPLTCFGDCLAAWLIAEEFDWLDAVQQLLRHGHIHFPVQPDSSPSSAALSLSLPTKKPTVEVPLTELVPVSL